MGERVADGKRLGAYRLEARLGSGAMGTVYRAWDEELEREVAVKVVHPHLVQKPGFFARFQREAEAGSRVEHENVVRTHDADFVVVDGTPVCFLVLEYVRGRTLRELLGGLGRVPEALLREIATQVAAGLAAIHAAGVVHRDLKPENVLITDDHRVRIMDLGIAHLSDAAFALTREGQFAGSLAYAAPEQFGGRAVGPAADLYALGVVLHELAAGVNPFRGEAAAEVMRAHLEQRPPPLAHVDPDTSPFLSAVVATLLEVDPAARFASAAELRQVLEEAEASAWWTARRARGAREAARFPRVPVRRETRLYGREADLALLLDLWGEACAGRGSTLLVEGEAGIGKSRLVDAFLEALGSGDVRALYGSYPPGGGDALAAALDAGLDGPDLATRLSACLADTPSLATPLAAWVQGAVPPRGTPSLGRDALPAALARLMQALASERPLLWVVEDVHNASDADRAALLALARAVEGHRVLLLLTTRPGGVPAEEARTLDGRGTSRRTTLGRLGTQDVVRLLEDAFHSRHLAERLGAKVAVASGGVPLFVLETVRSLEEGHQVTRAPDGSWVAAGEIDFVAVPTVVKDLIEARLEGLSGDERAVLDVAAVVGYEFDPTLVAAALGRPPVAVLQDLADVERRLGLVRAERRAYRFDHHQVQEVLDAGLALPLREAYEAELDAAYAVRAGAASRRPAAETPAPRARAWRGRGWARGLLAGALLLALGLVPADGGRASGSARPPPGPVAPGTVYFGMYDGWTGLLSAMAADGTGKTALGMPAWDARSLCAALSRRAHAGAYWRVFLHHKGFAEAGPVRPDGGPRQAIRARRAGAPPPPLVLLDDPLVALDTLAWVTFGPGDRDVYFSATCWSGTGPDARVVEAGIFRVPLEWNEQDSLVGFAGSPTLVVACATRSAGPDGAITPEIAGRFDVSPDGSRIAYGRLLAEGRTEVVVATPEGGAPRSIPTGTCLPGPSFSPDGRHLLFGDGEGGLVRLCVARSDLTEVRTVCQGAPGGHPDHAVWDASGTAVAYAWMGEPTALGPVADVHVQALTSSIVFNLTDDVDEACVPLAWR